MKGELKVVANADLGALGANQGPPSFYMWRERPLSFLRAFSPRVVPWLAILGLLFLKPNRCRQAWWVWLPLLAVAGLALGVVKFAWPADNEFRETVQPMLMALGFGWAGTLLLAPLAPWPRQLGRFGCLLLGLGVFALLGLAFSGDWEHGMFSEILNVFCAVMLQFTGLCPGGSPEPCGVGCPPAFYHSGLPQMVPSLADRRLAGVNNPVGDPELAWPRRSTGRRVYHGGFVLAGLLRGDSAIYRAPRRQSPVPTKA